jgi:hypothetical protein
MTMAQLRARARVRRRMRIAGDVAAHVAMVVSIFVVVGAFGHVEPKQLAESKADIANLGVRKLAYEAFPQWAREHPDVACPSSIADLAVYVDRHGLRDPWGEDYEMECRDRAPLIVIKSRGEDRERGTADDIASND